MGIRISEIVSDFDELPEPEAEQRTESTNDLPLTPAQIEQLADRIFEQIIDETASRATAAVLAELNDRWGD